MKDEVLGFGEEMRAATADEEAIVGVEVVGVLCFYGGGVCFMS